MSDQTALRLAEHLDTPRIGQHKAAAELRRLHAVNQELLEALRPFAVYGRWGSRDVEVGAARAAIAKAEGQACA